MEFTPTPLAGAWLIGLDARKDTRGSFVRAYCEREFSQRGLTTFWRQTNHTYSICAGTLRGLHFQRGAHQEIKLVRCLCGIAYDVIVDLRTSSPTRHQWFGIELDADRPRWLYVPQGFAHGLLTLTPNVEVEYMVSEFYAPDAEAGIRYNDPYFNIRWPRRVELVSPKDASWPDFDPAHADPSAFERL